MYTVKELIDALQKCPEDYIVTFVRDGVSKPIEYIGIDHQTKTVDGFDA